MRFIWGEYSHCSYLNQLSFHRFASPWRGISVMPALYFGKEFYFSSVEISVLSEGLQGVEQTPSAGHKSQFESRARDQGQRRDFLLLSDSTGPISVLCRSGSKPLVLANPQIHICIFSGQILTGAECHPVKSAQQQSAPLHKGWNCFLAVAITGHRSSSVPHHWVLQRELEASSALRPQRDLALRSKIEGLLAGVMGVTSHCTGKAG